MRVDSLPEISKHIWETKYRHPTDTCVADTWGRVARAVASVEENAEYWEKQFYELLEDFRFLPGGRILANAGTERTSTTMCNCFVMGTIPDSIEGIFDTVKEAALTQKQGAVSATTLARFVRPGHTSKEWSPRRPGLSASCRWPTRPAGQ